MNVTDLRMQILHLCGGDTTRAEQAYRWLLPAEKVSKALVSEMTVAKELTQAMTVGRMGTPCRLTTIDGTEWFYGGEPHGWTRVP